MTTTRTLRTAFATAALVLTASACGTTSTTTAQPADVAPGKVQAATNPTADTSADTDSGATGGVAESSVPHDVTPQDDAPPQAAAPAAPTTPTDEPSAPGTQDVPANPVQDGPDESDDLLQNPVVIVREVVAVELPSDLGVLKLNPDSGETNEPTQIDPSLKIGTLYPLPDFGFVYDPGSDEPPCGIFAAIADSASLTASMQIDALGDGSADDTITSYYDGSWHLRLVTSGGATSDLTIGGVGPGVVKALGAMSVDNGAADQLLAIVGSGASAANLGVFGADPGGCLFRFTHSDDTEIGLSVGATTGWRQGVRCTDGALISYGASNDGPDYWTTWGVGFERVGTTHLDFGLDDVGSSDTAGLVEYELDCPGLTL